MEADPANAPSRSDIRRRMALLAGIVLVADQITKQVMLDWIFFPPMRVSVLPFLDFVPVWNPGISFGMLAGGGVATKVILTMIALVVSAWLLWKGPSYQRLERLGAGLIVGGAIGNAIDRIRFGKVVDFIDVYVQTWHWPAFNIADAGITVGAGLWICSLLFDRESETE